MTDRQDEPLARAGSLMRAGLAMLFIGHRAAFPLALLYGLTGVLLAGLSWPYLRPESELATGDYIFLMITLNFLHYIVAVGIGVVWARAVLYGPEAAFAGGWRAFFTRWGRAASRLGSAALLMVLLALPAVFAAAMAGHILALLLGGETAQGFQLPLIVLALLPPAVIAAATLWLSVVGVARGTPSPVADTLKAVIEDWRRLAPLLLFAFLLSIGLQVLLLAVGSGTDALNPTTLPGMGAQILAAGVEMALIMVVIAAFAQLPPPVSWQGTG